MRWRHLIAVGFVILALGVLPMLAAEPGGDVFTVVVAAGTQPHDVQLRYVVTDQAGRSWRASEVRQNGNKLIISNSADADGARTFRAIAYAPRCQFVTISVGDLAEANSADFQCQKLPAIELTGRLAGGGLDNVQVETVYVLSWASSFFENPSISFSPFDLGKTAVQSDGSFTVELPDFAADPLWSRLSYNAGLMFYLTDAASGRRIGLLSSSLDTRTGFIKVEASYPREVSFGVAEIYPPGR